MDVLGVIKCMHVSLQHDVREVSNQLLRCFPYPTNSIANKMALHSALASAKAMLGLVLE